MSTSYRATGYVDIRIQLVNKKIYSTSSATAKDIGELIKNEYENTIGRCEVIDCKVMIESNE